MLNEVMRGNGMIMRYVQMSWTSERLNSLKDPSGPSETSDTLKRLCQTFQTRSEKYSFTDVSPVYIFRHSVNINIL